MCLIFFQLVFFHSPKPSTQLTKARVSPHFFLNDPGGGAGGVVVVPPSVWGQGGPWEGREDG